MRAGIFIDAGYFIKQARDEGVSPAYDTLAEFFLEALRRRSRVDVDLMRCYFYYCAPWMSTPPSDDELRRMEVHKDFVERLEALPCWQFRLGKLEKRREGDRDVFAQKRVDVLLSVDLVRHAAAGHIQHAILVAGDSDFIPAIAAAKESGVTLTLFCANERTVHRDLMKIADVIEVIDWKRLPQTKAAKPSSTEGARPVKSTPARAPRPKAAETQQVATVAEGVEVQKKKRRRRKKADSKSENSAG